MPRVEDFPPIVQAELEDGDIHGHEDDERGPLGLLKRLTHGLSRREEEPARLQPAAQPREPRLREPEARRAAGPDQLYAPQRGQLDNQGRVAVQRKVAEDEDQLDIPAFLRRQAN
jgi:cell division protein FtsZ